MKIHSDKINQLVFNYLSLMGIWDQDNISKDNPITKYFYNNIYEPSDIFDFYKKYNNENNSLVDINNNDIINILNESYKIYNNLDDIIKNQNEVYKQIIKQLLGDSDIDIYINEIIDNFKKNLFDILLEIEDMKILKEMKINIFNDIMMIYTIDEKYELANKIKLKIDKIKKEDY